MSLARRKFKIEEQPDELRNAGFGGSPDGGQPTLRRGNDDQPSAPAAEQNLVNVSYSTRQGEDHTFSSRRRPAPAPPRTETASVIETPVAASKPVASPDKHKAPTAKEEKLAERDRDLLGKDRWLVRNGHLLTYVGLYIFSVIVLFRPYEILPGMTWMAFSAFYVGVATLIIFFPSQLATEGNLTTLSTEVKAVLAMTAIAFLLIPIATDPGTAWETFNDPFVKAVAIFVVLVNVVRTRRRLMQMMWLSFGIGIYLSVCAVQLYMEGKFAVEDYRVRSEEHTSELQSR